jgi:hypothetical protein
MMGCGRGHCLPFPARGPPSRSLLSRALRACFILRSLRAGRPCPPGVAEVRMSVDGFLHCLEQHPQGARRAVVLLAHHPFIVVAASGGPACRREAPCSEHRKGAGPAAFRRLSQRPRAACKSDRRQSCNRVRRVTLTPAIRRSYRAAEGVSAHATVCARCSRLKDTCHIMRRAT